MAVEAHLNEGVEREVVLVGVARIDAGHGGGGDDDVGGLVLLYPGGDFGGGLEAGGVEVVFEISAEVEAFGGRAELGVAVDVLLGLGVDGVGDVENRLEKPAEFAVAGEGAVGNAGVDDEETGAGTFGFAPEVGPDFGLHDEDEAGLDGAHDAADGEAEIEGGVEDAVADAGEFFQGEGVTGGGGDGDVEGRVGEAAAHFAQEGAGGDDFADRDGVQPDAAGGRHAEGEATETAGDGAPPLAVLGAAPEQVQYDEWRPNGL